MILWPCQAYICQQYELLWDQIDFHAEFSRLPLHVQQALRELEEETKDCTKFIANICLSYGSRADITQAFQTLARRVAVGELAVHDVTEDAIAQSLTTASCPGS